MRLAQGSYRAKVVRRAAEGARVGERLMRELAKEPGAAILESSAMHRQWGRYTILACRPIQVLTLAGGVLREERGEAMAEGDAAIWAAMEEAMAAVTPEGAAPAGPIPGWIGYVGYEVGRHIEKLPGRARRDTALPDLRLAFYDALLVHDAVEGTTRLVELEFVGRRPPRAGEAGGALAELARRSMEHAAEARPAAEAADARRLADGLARAKANFTPAEYRRAVQRCIDYIAAGDIFQVNLSQRFEVAKAPEPMEIYAALRRRNPAWYAAYLAMESQGRPCAVLSCSPELFLQAEGGKALTRPIKGTRGRCGEAARDAAAGEELRRSEKDNAELAMIVDLLRNDLGRVCRYGSVRVEQACELETHPTVLHLVASVRGRLREGVGPAELLRATLPGGSITGAPKIRAMEIIDELEATARGVYTGCIGLVGIDGRATWNIAIRTIVCDGGRALVQAGGGIVADSRPEAEYEETLHKARGMLEAIALAMGRN